MRALQDLRHILKTIAQDVEVLPAVGGAVEDLERPDFEEREDQALNEEEKEGSESEDLPEKVIIFVDELNKYAPAREKESPIIEQVLDIAERGRSLGVVLLGAEQFMSEGIE